MKARLTVSLDQRLLDQVDRALHTRQGPRSRSAVIEDAVRVWANRAYEASIRDYYLDRPDSERAQDEVWADFAGRELSAVLGQGGRAEPRRPRRSRVAKGRRR